MNGRLKGKDRTVETAVSLVPLKGIPVRKEGGGREEGEEGKGGRGRGGGRREREKWRERDKQTLFRA